MFHWIVAHLASPESLWLLAQANKNPQGDAGFFGLPWWAPLPIIVILFYFMLIRPQQRERKTIQQMLDNLKKNDRVLTVGGIYGVVTNVRPEADRVTLRVDETSNTRMDVTLASIGRVFKEEDAEDKSSE